jgi:hypothetical protein
MSRILEITFVLIVLYLILTNAAAFGTATSAAGATYTQAVRALQGR